jgi:hypothetical protein
MESFTPKRLSDMTLIEVLQLWSESRKQAEKENQHKCSTKQDRKCRKALTNHETCERRTEKLAALLRDLQMAGPDDAEFVDFRRRVWTWSALNAQIRIAYKKLCSTFVEYFKLMHPDKRSIIMPLNTALKGVFDEFKQLYNQHDKSDAVHQDYSKTLIDKFEHHIKVWNKICREESQRSDHAKWKNAFIRAVFY